MIRSAKWTLAGLALLVALASCGCDQRVDSRKTPTPPVMPPPEVEIAATPPAVVADPPPKDPVKLQDEAIEALEAGDLDTAFKRIRAAIRITPDDPQTVFLMARVLAERNRFPEAIWMLDEMAVKVPDARLPVLGQTAEWMVLQGDWAGAEKRYRTLRSAVSEANARVVDRELARLLNRQGRRLEAATHLRELCRFGDVEESELRSLLIAPHPLPGEDANDAELEPIGPLGQARYEISQGNWDAALKALNRSTTKQPAEQALRGRIYSHQQDFASLGKWADDANDAESESADYWVAMGVHKAHQGEHPAAVNCFGQAVLHDQTDSQAYLLMSQSLEKLGASSEAEKTSARAMLIQQTQTLGNELAERSVGDIEKITTLVALLDELQRPMEALAWRAVQVIYGQSSSALSDQATMQALQEINHNRLQRLEANDTDATKQFILCGVDLDSL